MKECKTIVLPVEPGVVLNVNDCSSVDAEKEIMRKIPYRKLVGNLIFVAIVLRPDIMFAVT